MTRKVGSRIFRSWEECRVSLGRRAFFPNTSDTGQHVFRLSALLASITQNTAVDSSVAEKPEATGVFGVAARARCWDSPRHQSGQPVVTNATDRQRRRNACSKT